MRIYDLLTEDNPHTHTYWEGGIHRREAVVGPFHLILSNEGSPNPDSEYWGQIRYNVHKAFGLPPIGTTALLCSVGTKGLSQVATVMERIFWTCLAQHSLDLSILEAPNETQRSAWERLDEQILG
jgi:hypothetical protein